TDVWAATLVPWRRLPACATLDLNSHAPRQRDLCGFVRGCSARESARSERILRDDVPPSAVHRTDASAQRAWLPYTSADGPGERVISETARRGPANFRRGAFL